MATYSMRYTEWFMDSGVISEIHGIQSRNKLDLKRIYPNGGRKKACTKGLGVYTLKEGMWYMVKDTDEKYYKYANVLNGQINYISRSDVFEHFRTKEKKPSTSTTTEVIRKHSNTKDVKTPRLDYIQKSLEEAFRFLRVDNEPDTFKDMLSSVTNYAQKHGLIKESQEIFLAMSKRKSA